MSRGPDVERKSVRILLAIEPRSERGYSNKANIIKKLNILPACCKLSGFFWALLGQVTRGALGLYRAEGQGKFTDW